MKLLIFSDVHGDHAALERLVDIEADYYISAGDLVSWSRGLERCGDILRRRADKVYVLPGNHESAETIADFCAAYGFQTLHERTIEVGSYHVAGLGYSNPTPFNTPGEYSEPELERRLQPFAGLKPLVLICHAPPYGTALDQVWKGQHAGSTAVRDFIEKYQPEYFFCGHIHEAEGVASKLGKTRAVNAGKKGYLLELK